MWLTDQNWPVKKFETILTTLVKINFIEIFFIKDSKKSNKSFLGLLKPDPQNLFGISFKVDIFLVNSLIILL